MDPQHQKLAEMLQAIQEEDHDPTPAIDDFILIRRRKYIDGDSQVNIEFSEEIDLETGLGILDIAKLIAIGLLDD